MLPSYLRINVTQECIDYGEAVECELCPIALAIQSAFNDLGITGRVRVQAEDVCVLINREWRDYPLPEVAQTFISDFDQGKPVQPFNFLLSL